MHSFMTLKLKHITYSLGGQLHNSKLSNRISILLYAF